MTDKIDIPARLLANPFKPLQVETKPITGESTDHPLPDVPEPQGPSTFSLDMGSNHHAAEAFPVAPAPVQATCQLPAGMRFAGEASYPCHVSIAGDIDGQITTDGDHTITCLKSAKVTGTLESRNLAIQGYVDGTLKAAGLAQFGHTAKVSGEVQYGTLSIAEGAQIDATIKSMRSTH